MIEPLRARYGDVNRGHNILEWTGQGNLPSVLLGLTDKPTGTRGPDDRWWPSVGCGAFEGWWALWWTIPDRGAQRAGMVESEVALWPVASIGEVADLLPVLATMAGRDSITMPSDDYLGAIVEALVRGGEPPVLADLDVWPGVLAALWLRLSPTDRQTFSARVAMLPPQGGDSVMPPSLFVTRSDRTLQWPCERVITQHTTPAELSRAARWFLDREDPTIADLLDGCPDLEWQMNRLPTLARAADEIDQMNATSDPVYALYALRTLIAIAPNPLHAVEPKRAALRFLGAGLPTANLQFILALRNIKESAVQTLGDLNDGVRAWVDRGTPSLNAADAARLLSELDPDRAEPWWTETVSNGLGAALRLPKGTWAKAVLCWLALPACATALRELLPTTADVEDALFMAVSGLDWTSEASPLLLSEVRRRGWSRLHARVAIATQPAREAIRIQRASQLDEDPGLEVIVELVAGQDLVQEAVDNPDTRFVGLVARRTVRQPELLAPLDPQNPAWRGLWEAHIKAGGEPWPPRADRSFVSTCLLDATLDGEAPESLLRSLAKDMGPFVFGYKRRAALWDVLPGKVKDSLLAAAAAVLLEQVDAGITISPEPPLAAAAFLRAANMQPRPTIVAALLKWDVDVTEQQMIHWLHEVTPERWKSVALQIGEEISRRRWSEAAAVLADQWASRSFTRPGAIACAELLPRWRRWRLGLDAEEASRSTLIERVVELGAEHAPDELDMLWERAGGKRKVLPSGTPEIRWREAARAAEGGALKNGLVELVEQLLSKLPYNRNLQELAEVLRNNGRRR
ncbi:effector-associated domain EAD1-containing protein [Nannocystaceae bacterium ST9]